MPLYAYTCSKCKKKTELIKKYEEKQVDCECGGVLERQLSYHFNATNLPNGFAPTRTRSRKEEK